MDEYVEDGIEGYFPTELIELNAGAARVMVLQRIWWLLAEGHCSKGRAVAELAHERWAAVLGEDHPDTIRAADHLAFALWTQGDLAAARSIQEDTLTRARRVLGDDHPNTIQAAAHLAVTLGSQDDLAAARPIHEEVLTRYRRVWGTTTRARSALGGCLRRWIGKRHHGRPSRRAPPASANGLPLAGGGTITLWA